MELAGDPGRVGSEVVVWGERDPAAVVEVDGKDARAAVEGVAADVGGEEPDGEAAALESVIGREMIRVAVRVRVRV